MRIGAGTVTGLYLGSTAVSAAYLGATQVFGGAAPAWSPAELFAASEQGIWLDPSDLSTVFTDTAGTTPAVVGDPVARINDKSGRGNHATQSISAARPILRESGGRYYLEFDGVDDFLLPPSGMTSTWTVAHAMSGQRQTTGGTGAVISRWGTVNLQDHEPFSNELYSSFGKTTRNKFGSLLVDVSYVIEYQANASDLIARVNGIQSGSTFASTTGWRTQPYIGGGALSQNYFKGNMYSVLVINRVLSAPESVLLREHTAIKTGVTL
jgi:hypothetical protein